MKTSIKLHITRHGKFAGGERFGDSGPYELLAGRVDLAVDPKAAAPEPGTYQDGGSPHRI